MDYIKPLSILIVLLAIIAGLSFIASVTSPDTGNMVFSESALSVMHEGGASYDFGVVPMYSGDVEHSFTLINNGSEPVGIERMYTSCMCTTASVIRADGTVYGPFGMPGHGIPARANIEAAPGEKLTIVARFDPAAHGPAGVGRADRDIILETNSTQMPEMKLSFTADITR